MNFISRLLALCIILFGNTASGAEQTKGDSVKKSISILLIGNSLMSGVSAKLKGMLEKDDYAVSISVTNPGGAWLRQHDSRQPTNELLRKKYDIVFIQEQSGGIGSHVAPYVTLKSLKNKIEKYNGKMVFYQTWGFESRVPKVTNYILSRYEDIAADLQIDCVPIGRAWDYYYKSNDEAPPFPLFADKVHANLAGQCLVAYVMFTYLAQKSPVGRSGLGLDQEQALILQTVAWKSHVASQSLKH